MKQMFLASSVETTGPAIGKETEILLGKKTKDIKLVFILTAGLVEEEQDWIDDDRNGLIEAGFDITDYDIALKTPKDLEKDLVKYDVVHINGGNQFYLLLKARESGFDKWVTKKVLSGEIIYTGSSAGSMICAPDIEVTRRLEDNDYKDDLNDFKAFGLTDFIIFPHWGSEHFKNSYLGDRLTHIYKPENKIILLNDFQYIKVEAEMYKIVDTRGPNM